MLARSGGFSVCWISWTCDRLHQRVGVFTQRALFGAVVLATGDVFNFGCADFSNDVVPGTDLPRVQLTPVVTDQAAASSSLAAKASSNSTGVSLPRPR